MTVLGPACAKSVRSHTDSAWGVGGWGGGYHWGGGGRRTENRDHIYIYLFIYLFICLFIYIYLFIIIIIIIYMYIYIWLAFLIVSFRQLGGCRFRMVWDAMSLRVLGNLGLQGVRDVGILGIQQQRLGWDLTDRMAW